MARYVTYRSAAIRSLPGDKRTWRRHRQLVAQDLSWRWRFAFIAAARIVVDAL